MCKKAMNALAVKTLNTKNRARKRHLFEVVTNYYYLNEVTGALVGIQSQV